ncbi:transporter substrate-binding domain-containing protein [Rugamonas rivuli]|uniref:Transporter substrate-binding domain-containing protein n=1 Tax=Rugamonas rivuli TaxID=2743358 RepID=A0A843SCK7_9BURK|nr:transporter substrate-binding domain-containing protein [Rugamonas rivuli]MQA19814.1 transporter substrate-binding domain-containing protein [Rugamonas rivuli]
MTGPRCATMIAVSCLLLPLGCAAENAINVGYSERPPYMIPMPDGAPSGLTGTPTAKAFKTAGIPVVWHNVPTNRQLIMIHDATALNCAVGWFWTAERDGFAKFTKPIYRDKDWMVLANAALAARGDTTLRALLQRPETRILVKDNYSYGTELDKLLAPRRASLAISTAASGKMVQSIAKGVVDMMFVSEDEGHYIMAHHPSEQTRNLRLLHFKDMPHGPERHIMCSKAVPDDVINRLNKAITLK